MAKADDALIRSLAAGDTVEVASRKAGVGRATAYRRLQDADFRRRIEEARADLWKRTMAVLSKSAVESAIALRRLLRSENEKLRLQAAKIVLEQGVKVRDQVELAQRLTAVEANLTARQEKEKP